MASTLTVALLLSHAPPILSASADLTGLTLSAGTLTPAFNSNVLSYTASVAYTNSSVVVTPVSAETNATIQVISTGVTNVVPSGLPSAAVALKPGQNLIVVRVTAPDASVTKDYSVSLKRIPPNIIVALVDDMGWSDLGCYGSEISTPNIDSLAAGGIRFRNFHNGARCSPTRCSLITGLYPQQAAVDPAQALPNLRNDNNVTFGELFGANGFRTYLAGKWHLGNTAALLPEGRGFQHVWRFSNGTSSGNDQWAINTYTLVSQNSEIAYRPYSGPGETFYQTDAIGDYAVDYINHNLGKADGAPFMMYLAFGAPHFPIQAPLALTDTYAAIYQQGWDTIRYGRYTNQLAKGIIDSRYPFPGLGGTAIHQNEPVEAIPAWNTIAAGRQADLVRRMALFAAMIDKVDQNIGKLVSRLRETGQLDNTLIFFLSDNGGNHERGRFGTWNSGSASEGPALAGAALTNMGQAGQNDNIHYGGGWAHVSNTPYRLFKHFAHGGGIRTPLIVHWPQGLTRTNEWEEQPGHLIDIMATIVDVTGVSYPTQFNSHAVLPLEGRSLKPLFAGEPPASRQLAFEHESNRALIDGDWKLVTKNFDLYDGSSPANELELYNLSSDPGESTNLATLQPARLNQMVTNWNTWAARVGVPAARFITIPLPVVNPAPSPGDLLLDTFARSNATDIDVSALGISGSRVPPLGANATYYEGFEGSGSATSIQISGGALQMAVGAGMSENGLRHNFVGQDIVDAGGFSVELTVQSINTDSSDAANRYVGFGVGLSQAEAATGWDIGNALGAGAVAFRGRPGGNTGVSDFFVELDLNGNVKVWSNGALLDTGAVGQNSGTLTASFALAGFTTNDTVTVNVFFNGRPVDINTANPNSISRTFNWGRNDSNYIGLSARASNFTQLDNLAIRRLPLSTGLAIGYAMQHGLSGADTDPGADPDGDGANNFAEWSFGGNPTAADSFIATLRGTLLTSSRDFQFEFQRLINAASYGLQYRYFVSEDLSTWSEVTPVVISANPNGANPNYESVTLQLPASAIAGEDKLFLRVRAEPVD